MTLRTRPDFTHLHVASSYSLRYGTATPRALAARAADLGMPALALTDRDGLYGAFKHVSACANVGIKPLLGVDLALSPRADSWHGRLPPPITPGGPSQRVTLLAAGRRGWASLCRLVSAAHAAAEAEPGTGRAADDDVPAVTPELIAEHAAGLVLLLGPASDVGQAVAARRRDLARRLLARWRSLDCEVVVEITDHLEYKSTATAARLAELARDSGTTAVLANAVRYLDPADSPAAQVLDAARHLVPLGSPKLVPHNGRAYLAGPAEMGMVAERVAAAMTGPDGRPGATGFATRLLAATEELAARCALDPARDLGVGAHHLPAIGGAVGEQQRALRDRCEHAILHGEYRTARADSRPPGVSRQRAARDARDRLESELAVITATGMASYFLTVADVADRIRAAGIRCAIRGSGAGCFVNHLLGISAIDPLEHDLLMERFLTPVRATLPDIDLDVESARRLDAYRIIFDAYGAERTACVCMMETYRARSAIRDVAAAMSFPPDEVGAIAKAFPHIRAKHITAALTELPELRRSRVNTSQLATIFSIAEQLDGLPRHVAMHPCGVLLSDRTLLDRTAVQASAEGFPLSHLDKDDAEIAGVIKLDVLGVRMQSAMAHTLAEIERTTTEKIDIDAMPRDDEATYAMIGRSDTLGCFQIESPGQRELVKKVAPRDVADLIVDISLFRPGPVNSDMISPFLRTRHGLAEARYPHEKLRAVLRETGGVVVFHEQVLRIIDVMTGCGLPEADLVRRHLSAEKGPERTAPWFRAKAAALGFDPATIERVWEVVAAFGGFGFCKAHAAAFAIPVYQSAWLKRHHPAAFYAGVLTHDPGMYPKRVIIADARLSGVQVLPVDVNASSGHWKTEKPSLSAPPPDGPDSRRPVPDGYGPASDGRGSGPDGRRRASDGRGPASDGRRPASDGHRSGRWAIRLPGRRDDRLAAADGASPALAIRCSLREVKGISDAEVARITAGQPYTSLRDFWDRARVSRPVVERLALIGAFDSLLPAAAPAGALVPPSTSILTDILIPTGTSIPIDIPVPTDIPTPTDMRVPTATPTPAAAPALTRRDLLARVGVLARQSASARQETSAAPDLFAAAEAIDDMADLVPAGELRDLDLAERVAAELEILGFDVSQHVLEFYADLLAELNVVRSASLDGCGNGETVLVAGAKVATQTPAVRSGQRIIFASLDDAVGLVDLAFFESVQDRCASRLFGSWLLLVRGRVRRAGAGPMAVTVNATECWDIPALEEIRVTGGIDAVRAAMAVGDVGPGAPHIGPANLVMPRAPHDPSAPHNPHNPKDPRDPRDPRDPNSSADPAATDPSRDDDASARPLVFANGFTLSPYAETGAPGGNLKNPPRTLWHASPGSSGTST
jgi:error-prone DNA polymerase